MSSEAGSRRSQSEAAFKPFITEPVCVQFPAGQEESARQLGHVSGGPQRNPDGISGVGLARLSGLMETSPESL